jgi:hypothetical protein
LILLVEELQYILKREETENEDIDVSINSSRFQKVWKKYCESHEIESEEGLFSIANIRAAIRI